MILSKDLQNIKIISEPTENERQKFMLAYIRQLSEYSATAELRSHWTMILKCVNKQIGNPT